MMRGSQDTSDFPSGKILRGANQHIEQGGGRVEEF